MRQNCLILIFFILLNTRRLWAEMDQPETSTDGGEPSPLINLTIEAGSDPSTQLEVGWEYGEGEKDKLTLKITEEGSSIVAQTKIITDMNKLTDIFDDLTPGKQYTVEGIVGSNNLSSDPISATETTMPSNLTSLTLETVSGFKKRLRAEWTYADENYDQITLMLDANGVFATNKTYTNAGTKITSHNFTQLIQGQQYTVRAFVSSNGVAGSKLTSDPATVLPEKPSSLNVDQVSSDPSTQLRVRWVYNDLDGIRNNTILSLKSAEDVRHYEASEPERNHTFTNLTPGRSYVATALAQSYGVNASQPIEGTVSATKPSPLSGLTLKAGSDSSTQLEVGWEYGDGEKDKLTLKITEEGSSIVAQTKIITDMNKSTDIFDDLTPGKQYTVEGIVGSNNLSSKPKTKTKTTIPQEPSYSLSQQNCSAEVEVNFSTPANATFDYHRVVYTGGVAPVDVPSSQPSLSVRPEQGVPVHFSVRTFSNHTDNIYTADPAFSAWVNKTINTKPPKITDFNATQRVYPDTDKVDITYKGFKSGFKYRAIVSGNCSQPKEHQTATHNTNLDFTFDSLKAGTSCKYLVESLDVDGYPHCSAAYKSLLLAPNPVNDFQATKVDREWVLLEWKDPSDGDFARVKIQTKGAVVEVERGVEMANISSSLVPGKMALYTAITFSAGNVSSIPRNTSASTKPSPVEELRLENVEGSKLNQLNASWVFSGVADTLVLTLYASDRSEVSAANLTDVDIKYHLFPNLTAGERYTASAVVTSNNLTSDVVDAVQSTYPASVTSLNVAPDPSSNTSKLMVTWELPEGRYDNFTVSLNGNGNKETKTTNKSATEFENLTAGRSYQVEVRTNSFDKESQPVDGSSFTVPAAVDSLIITRDSGDPTTKLKVVWKIVGDSEAVKVNLRGERGKDDVKDCNKTVADDVFDCEFTNLLPGEKYTAEAVSYVDGSKLQSSPRTSYEYTEPVKIEDIWFSEGKKEGQVEVTVAWNHTRSGELDWYKYRLTYQRGDEVYPDIESDVTSSVLDLDPNSRYEFRVAAFVKDATLGDVVGEAATKLHTTSNLPAPPPATGDRVSEVRSEKTQIAFSLAPDTFSNKNGPIQHYAVFLTTSKTSSSDGPNVESVEACQGSDDVTQCVAMWTDAAGNPLLSGGGSDVTGRRKRSFTQPEGNPRIAFTVGDDKRTVYEGEEFRNIPLSSGTSYRFSVAAKVEGDERLVATEWSSVITTETEVIPTPDYTGAIVGIVVAFVVIIGAIVAYVCYRRRQTKSGSAKIEMALIPKTDEKAKKPNYHDNNQVHLQPIGERTSSPLDRLDFLTKFVAGSEDDDVRKALDNEYEEFKMVGRNQPTKAAQEQFNRGKNRYTNILPYDHSRVRMDKVNGQPGSDYINANYIAGVRDSQEYIAAQGPLPGTKDDFWRMIWEENSRSIVMVTQTVERAKVKCDHYWPFDNEPVEVGDLKLTMHDEEILPEWTTRQFDLYDASSDEHRSVTQYHYTVWPDHGVPDPASTLVGFIRYVRRATTGLVDKYGPTVVHCSAGVGRTGTYIALDQLLHILKRGSPVIDIFGIVYNMRKCRMFMVQTESQYILLHQVVRDYLNNEYNEDDDEPVYANAASIQQQVEAENVYENTTTFHHPNGGNVNPALVPPSHDAADDHDEQEEEEEEDDDDVDNDDVEASLPDKEETSSEEESSSSDDDEHDKSDPLV